MTLFPEELINFQNKWYWLSAKSFLRTLYIKQGWINLFLIIEWVQSLREIQLFLTLYGVSVVICDTLFDSLQGLTCCGSSALIIINIAYFLHGIQRNSCSFLSLVTKTIFFNCHHPSERWRWMVSKMFFEINNVVDCGINLYLVNCEAVFLSWNRADNVLQQTSCFLDAQIRLLTVFCSAVTVWRYLSPCDPMTALLWKWHNCHCFQFYYWIRICYKDTEQNY